MPNLIGVFARIPTPASFRQNLLVLDTDLSYAGRLQQFYREHALRVHVEAIDNLLGAERYLANREHIIMGIVMNSGIGASNCISVAQATHVHRPAIPMFLLRENTEENSLLDRDFRSIGIRDILPKSENLEDLHRAITPLALNFVPKEVLDSIETRKLLGGADRHPNDEGYVAVSAIEFLTTAKSLFNVYVRLERGRYLKLLKVGDTFDPERVGSYLSKGVLQFYIEKEARESYLQFCLLMTEHFVGLDSVSNAAKLSQAFNVGSQIMAFMLEQGISEASIKYATTFVRLVNSVVRSTRRNKDDPVEAFIANADAYDHGVSTAMAMALLSVVIEIKFDKPAQTLGVAAMLHDIGLYQLPKEIWHEDESLMTPEQQTLYRTHPERGVEILRELRRFDPASLQAIELHHQRRDGRGFPKMKASGSIPRAAEMVGISEQFDLALRKKRKEPELNLREYMEEHVFPAYSRQVVYAFRSALFPRNYS